MLTRLKVNGFKNLVRFDLQFGALTCIAGENAVGKSNIFDAIDFLHRLADQSLIDAALGVRNTDGRGDLRRLFHHEPHGYTDQMDFEVEMIVPASGTDDLGQSVEASATFLNYKLSLGWRPDSQGNEQGALQVLHEELKHITRGDAHKHLRFPHAKGGWRDRVLRGKGNGHRTAPFISTGAEAGNRIVRLHQDGQGKPRPFRQDTLPRTLLSTATMADGPTVSLARLEMRSWMQLQLEPSALRKPSEFLGPKYMKANGDGVAAALYRLVSTQEPELHTPLFGDGSGGSRALAESAVCARIANRLSGLIGGVARIWVDRDPKRELFTLMLEQTNGASFPASSLSDGTLRFLAMAILEEDAGLGGVVCLEEPENGIHPGRIPAMIQLLEALALDPQEELPEGEAMRQVIFNTHSPVVFQNVKADDLVFVKVQRGNHTGQCVEMEAVANSWRSKEPGARILKPGHAQDYMEVLLREDDSPTAQELVGQQLRFHFNSAA